MNKIPRNEQETLIHFDVELQEWSVYSNYAPHIRRYKDKVIPKRMEYYSDGSEAVLEGVIDGSVGVRGKVKLTEEQREERSRRLRKLNQK